MANPFEFLQQVRSEGAKVTWPTRRETLITTALVVLMVIVASIFFIAVDQTIRIVLGFILSLGR
jgi:preprotein translocase subunit SecE